ncbi:VOC family protein [Duganella radicis]|uniref:Glyoxalase n=1 Tax=Duganella radicis TaxID=551988 RepID=A0A6L6PE30_9BURK|nr:VOC family protein [Duganella radicis]MTV37254.1 glyoxalase [Duganella radicis]
MSSIPKQTLCGVIPCLRYRDAHAAIDWLCGTLGFKVQFVVPEEDGSVAHAQLTFGNSMVMLGSAFDTPYGRLLKQPDDIGGFVTQSTYLVVNDADLVYGRVLEAGGRILLDIKNEDYGGRGFTCADPEGHIWSIGTYDPYATSESAPTNAASAT